MSSIENFDPEEWAQESRAVLTSNVVQVDGHRYTRPAPSIYEHQWLWDSCFHAIIWRWLDPQMAWDELRTLAATQVQTGDDAGMIPHMTYWRGGGEPIWQNPNHSVITQPPLMAVAAELVLQTTGDTASAGGLLPAIRAFHEWFDRRRDPDGDDLVSLIHPWECGCDAAPRWNQTRFFNETSDEGSKAQRHALVAELISHGCDALALAKDGLYHVEPVDYNAFRAADLDALARLENVCGDAALALRWSNKARRIREAIGQKMLMPGPQAVDLQGLDEGHISDEGSAKYLTLFGGCAPVSVAAQLADELRGIVDAPAYPVPTVPVNHPLFGPGRYWRGNVWPPVNWLIFMGLRHYGYEDIAKKLAERTLKLVDRAGFREYFNPITGEGCGGYNQSWTPLVFDMAMQMQNANHQPPATNN
ncbi:MAG TPA: trehalase family glycosidase [Thermoflexales bacterium]|nr:trehalase family glycosidase [Thermoflexales bacterium]